MWPPTTFVVETSWFSKLVSFTVECACPEESCYRANRFCKLYRTWLKRHRFSRERKFMRDKKRIGGRERSLYLISFFSFCERPLLAGNRYNEPSMRDTHHLLKSWNWYSKEAWENSQHFATPPLVSTRNDVWETRPRSGKGFWLVMPRGKFALFGGKPGVGSQNVGCFPRLWQQLTDPIVKYSVHKGNLWRQYACVYSYFEKCCRIKCTRQPRKVLWVVLSALFFKEIWKKGTRGHGHMSASAKGKQQK